MLNKFTLMLALLALTLPVMVHAADAPKWVEGENYHVIEPALPTSNPDKVEVVEVFSYACPHCAHFQPTADKLKASLPKGVVWEYKPAVFHQSWQPFARAFLAAKSMGILDKTHEALFKAIHEDRKQFRSLQDLGQFYADFGVDPGAFVSTAESFIVTNQMREDMAWERKAGIRGTPSIIVNGKYVLGPNSAGGFEQMAELTQWLVQRELASKKGQ